MLKKRLLGALPTHPTTHTLRMRYDSACACVRLLSHPRMRQPARIVVCMRHVRDKGKCTPSLRMSRVEHAFSFCLRHRTHAEACTHAPAFQ
jgi:hypothetical protein